ncbi:hypothetical protein ACOMHN_064385 [Nucella lapillus]
MSGWWDDSSPTLVTHTPSSPPLSADDVTTPTTTTTIPNNTTKPPPPPPRPSAPPQYPPRGEKAGSSGLPGRSKPPAPAPAITTDPAPAPAATPAPAPAPASSSSSSSASPSLKHHSLFSKKSKAAKGLGFLIKASKETARKRSKSPSKSLSKSPSQENLAEDLEPVDERVKAKSEQWQAFLQMQDRIKLNVLKTQQNIGKLAAGRISPSGRISPAKHDQLKANEDEGEDSALTPWSNRGRDDEAWTDDSTAQGDRVGPWGTLEGDEEKTHSEESELNREVAAGLPHLRVTAARPAEPRLDFEKEGGVVDLLSGFKPVPPSTPVDPEVEEVEEVVDLLGLGAEPTEDSSGTQPVPYVLNEDLLGLDDFLGGGGSAADPPGVDWFTGSSTTYSSTQSSLSSSPVAFDLDFFLEQEQFGSTAVSDLARTLVDDFMQWGAEASKDDDLRPASSSNPFASDIAASAATSKASSVNPFATGSDQMDTAIGFSQKVQHPKTAKGFYALDPFSALPSAPTTGDSNSIGADPFSCIHVSAPTSSSRDVDPFRTTDMPDTSSTEIPSDKTATLDPFSSAPDPVAHPESGVNLDPFSSNGPATSESQFASDPFSSTVAATSDSQFASDPFSSNGPATSESQFASDPFSSTVAATSESQFASDPFSSTVAATSESQFASDPFSSTVAATFESQFASDPFSSTVAATFESQFASDPFSSNGPATSESRFASDPFSSTVAAPSASESQVDADPFGFMASVSASDVPPPASSAGVDPFGGMNIAAAPSESGKKEDVFGSTAMTSLTAEVPSFSSTDVDPFTSVTTASPTAETPRGGGETLDPFGCPVSGPPSLDFNANPRSPPEDPSNITDSAAKPIALNPFLAEPVEEQTPASVVSFDEDFFSSKLRPQVQQDADSVWGTAAQEAASPEAFNPFENDLFVGAKFPATGTDIPAIRSDDGGHGTGGGSIQPINPFLTASFENLSISAAPVANVHQLFLASTDELDTVGTEPAPPPPPPAEPSDPFDPFSNSAVPASQAESAPGGDLLAAEREEKTAVVLDRTEDDDHHDDDEEDKVFKLHIRAEPIKDDKAAAAPVPFLPPPPKRPKSPPASSRENPFDKESPPEEDFANFEVVEEDKPKETVEPRGVLKSMSSESSTYDEENMEPLEPFIPVSTRTCWKLMLRYPLKKKLAGNRYWKTVYARVELLKDGPVLKAYDKENCEGEVLQELPLQPCYSLSELTAQQYDQYGKIHTVKVQYIFYRERVGIKPERITSSFVKKPKATMVLDHAPQVSELLKFGSLDKEEMCSFIHHMEDAFMKMDVKREKTLTYTKDEIQAEVWDEYMAVIDKDGHTTAQKARVRIFVLAFLTGMPACELGVNDKMREGKEVVGRHDIIPVRTEDWIRIENPEFHSVVDMDNYEKFSNIRFRPLDACQFELLRFRVRPRENRELPLQLRATQLMKDRHFELRCDMLVTGYHAFSKKCGQFPCEEIEIRFKIPESWIYYFRYERKFRYGSLKAMTRKPGKIKGLERLTMMAQGMLSPALMETSVGTAKYEHVHRSVVWRVARLPERNQGAYKNHMFVLRLDLGSHDELPSGLEEWCDVSFTTPATTVSKAQVRSISVENPDPPGKWVRYVSKYQYRVQLDNKVETTSDIEHDD